jgi:hypothetical protein
MRTISKLPPILPGIPVIRHRFPGHLGEAKSHSIAVGRESLNSMSAGMGIH